MRVSDGEGMLSISAAAGRAALSVAMAFLCSGRSGRSGRTAEISHFLAFRYWTSLRHKLDAFGRAPPRVRLPALSVHQRMHRPRIQAYFRDMGPEVV